MGGRHHRIPAARHVAADARHRDVLMPKPHPGQRLDLYIAQRGTLRFGKVAHLRLCETNILDHPPRRRGHQRLELRARQAETRRLPPIELRRKLAHRNVAACCHVIEDALCSFAHLPIRREGLCFGNPLFEVPDHRAIPPSSRHPLSALPRSSAPTHPRRETPPPPSDPRRSRAVRA